MELDKIAGTLALQNPQQAQKLDKELERLLAVLEETGTAVLSALEKARYRKEKDPEKIRELRRVYRTLRKEIESIEVCRETFGNERRKAAASAESRERIDYEQYRVDETVGYSLESVVTNKKPAGFSIGGVRYEAGSWKQVLLLTCAALNRMDPMLFSSLERDPELQGRRRPYFSANGDGLDTPAKVPDADLFVETHVSARYLTRMIRRLLRKFGIPEREYVIYLRKDFTALHEERKADRTGNRPAGMQGRRGMPGQGIPGQGMPGQEVFGQGMPGQGMFGQGMPGQEMQGMSGQGGASGDSAPEAAGTMPEPEIGQLSLLDWEDGDWI